MARRARRAPASDIRLAGVMKEDRALKVKALGHPSGTLTDFYHQLLRFTWPQLFGLFTGAFFVFNLVFAGLYMLDPDGLSRATEPAKASPFWQEFFFSVHTVATIGYGNVYPVSLYANILVVVEITLGILFFALATGIAFARFSRPTARVLFSSVAVVQELGGVPTLMFRAANQRHNFIFEAHADVSLLMDEAVDGTKMRRFQDLKLVRTSNPVFALTWTIMHRIDATSPLAGWAHGDVPEDAEIIVVLSGTDGRTGQTIYARWAYGADDIRWNSRFVDILGQLDDGTRTIDYQHFHDVIPAGAQPSSNSA